MRPVIKMMVTDLDCTLLHSGTFIAPRTLEALEYCRSKGIVVAYATARSAQAAAAITAQFEPDAFIGYGGALITRGGRVIHRCAMPPDVCFDLACACLAEPDIEDINAIDERIALTTSRKGFKRSDFSHYKNTDRVEDFRREFLKMSVNCTHHDAVRRVAERFPMLDVLTYTNEDLHRFAHREALKWNAVQALARHMDIDTADIVAFGDDVNDLDMVRRCGVGVAVSNAVGAVKDVADCVCGSNDEDGVAEWLFENV